MRAKWQPLVAGRIDLRAMMVEKQKCAEAIQSGSGDRPTGFQIAYVVTVRRMAAQDAPERRRGLCHSVIRRGVALMLMGFWGNARTFFARRCQGCAAQRVAANRSDGRAAATVAA
jgi:hypothetical protein